MERAENDLRELDERPVSRRCAVTLHLAGGHHDASGALAHVPGADEASERLRDMLAGLWDAAKEPHIWWGVQWRIASTVCQESPTCRRRPPPCGSCQSSRCWKILEAASEGISWVIVGGESGPGARPMKEWVLPSGSNARPHVPFFFKQWGGVRKKVAGRTLRGRTYDGFRTGSKIRPCRHPSACSTRWRLRAASWFSSEQLSLDFLAPARAIFAASSRNL